MQMKEPQCLPAFVLEKTDPCWFCESEKPVPDPQNEENEEPASPEGQNAGPENGEHNDASNLGLKLKNRPKWSIDHKVDPEDPIEQGEKTDVVPAAHHLLPGNASVNKAFGLHKYMLWGGCDNELSLSGPIGYDINNAQNGVWLPGNYAVRKESDFKKNFSKFKDPFKNAYARQAMKNAGDLQLHDAHPDYNVNVKTTLIDTAKKLDEKWVDRSKCPICGKDLKEMNKNKPPYGLVWRLNLLSAEHKKALIFTPANKKAIASGYYTSSRALLVYG